MAIQARRLPINAPRTATAFARKHDRTAGNLQGRAMSFGIDTMRLFPTPGGGYLQGDIMYSSESAKDDGPNRALDIGLTLTGCIGGMVGGGFLASHLLKNASIPAAAFGFMALFGAAGIGGAIGGHYLATALD